VVVPQVYKKQLFAASCAKKTHAQWSHAPLFRPDRVWFKAKNALNRVRPSKIKKIFFIFNYVLFKKLVLNIIQ
jgi:hypothetical protein